MGSRDESDEGTPLDPVALTLAVWLGLIVTVMGLGRMSEQAAARAALNRYNAPERNLFIDPRFVAFAN